MNIIDDMLNRGSKTEIIRNSQSTLLIGQLSSLNIHPTFIEEFEP